MHTAEIEALRQIVDLISEMLDCLQTVDADRQHVASRFRWGIEQLHRDLLVHHRLAPAEADALLARTLCEAGKLVRSRGGVLPVGVA